MSATMPLKLKHLLTRTLGDGNYSLIQDKELLDQARNIFETRDCLIDDLLDDIIYAIETGKKVLVVVNTVDEAIRVYSSLKNMLQRRFVIIPDLCNKIGLTKKRDIVC